MVGMGLGTATDALARVVGGLGVLWEGREHFPFAATNPFADTPLGSAPTSKSHFVGYFPTSRSHFDLNSKFHFRQTFLR